MAAAETGLACLDMVEALVLDFIIVADCISIYLVSDLRILSSVERVSSGLLEALIIACCERFGCKLIIKLHFK